MSLPSNYNLLAKYSNEFYVETGVWRGDSLQMALDAGYKQVFGIDIDNTVIDFCKDRFAMNRHQNGHVFLRFENGQSLQVVQGDSAKDLWDKIKIAKLPITFFLDSHWQLFEGTDPGPNPFPLLKELEQIGRHPIKTHTILIDDVLVLTHPDVTGWSRKIIEDAVMAINPSYKFEYVANPIINNLLICTV